ncbi:LysR family transcriptional regulator [Parvularcula flava]|uniref:Transcriptional regulator n=1 Tax=Aquisalinus luteolus TaxID=1566827 RepID=A0A8J3EPP9_9PROT|nr:LysR family transcriptional regulator [Aquisalinus luteolus]NHK26380.1 LysR family transcriptional regulator [Aquisalinus luteolus]GGH92160.1 transcriptional regulator [Aquisalinus luteolus]
MNTSDPLQLFDQVSWDDFRMFLEIVDAGSLRAAADQGTFSISTIRRRLPALEERVGEQLIKRSVEGVQLTPFGERFLAEAREVEEAVRKLARITRLGSDGVRGQISISITEGLGLFWLVPFIVDFQRNHPGLTIDLNTQMAKGDVLRKHMDVSVQFAPPEEAELITKPLGRLHLMLCTSPGYEKAYGLPKKLEDLKDHKLGFQAAEQLDESAFFEILEIPPHRRFVSFRVNSSVTYYELIRRGAIIGVMPTYLLAMETGLIPIQLGPHYHRDLFISYHTDFIKSAAGKATVDFLKNCFDKKKFPFFAETFFAPEDLAGQAIIPATRQLFPQYLKAL